MKHADQVPTIYADIVLVERVIQNLLNNALKYTPEEGTITVSISEGKNGVAVEVADMGKGISEEEQAHIFDRYQKGKSSTGAGLGLTIVKKILELHNSNISLKSQLNEGTTFMFNLPVLPTAKTLT